MLLSDKEQLFLAGELRAERAPETLQVKSSALLKYEPDCTMSSPVFGPGDCFVGAHSYMNSAGYIRCDQGGVFIGRYCSIGRRVTIGAGSHSLAGLSTSPALRGVGSRPYTSTERDFVHSRRLAAPIVIESDVWIGDGAVVMSGVRIGVGAVIGANCVVTRDIEPYQIVGGVPAKPIGERFASDIASRLAASRWWECDRDYLNSLPLANVLEFLEALKFKPISQPTYA